MPNTDNLCMHCMHPVGDDEICPHCHQSTNMPQYAPYLPIKVVLTSEVSRYLVGNVLDENGDGITYIGWDLNERVPVKIREFLPKNIVKRNEMTLSLEPLEGCEQIYRDCMQSFSEMWRSLMRYNGLSCLIKVGDMIEANNTVYAIYEHSEDITLREYLIKCNNGQGGNIGWEQARQLFMPLLSTLNTLHSSGIIHRGISTNTLLVGSDGKLKLSGFSIWQARTERSDLQPEIFNGYAALEQYGFDGQQGQWTDVYSLAAVIYRALTGSDPIIATERAINDKLMIPARIAESLPAYVVNALVNALQILPEDRTRNIEQFRAELSASPSAAYAGEIHAMNNPSVQGAGYYGSDNSSVNPNPNEPQKKKMNAKLKAFLISTVAVMGAGILIFIILFFLFFKDNFEFPENDESDISSTDVSESETVETVVVSDFRNLSYTEILNNPVHQDNFTFKIKKEYSDTVKEDYVISQSLLPQSAVEKGSEIVLTISKGKESIEVPNVIGLTYDEAKKQLSELGFICTATSGNKQGVVKSMSEKPGSKCEKGTIIELTCDIDDATEAPSEQSEDSTNSGNGIFDGILPF